MFGKSHHGGHKKGGGGVVGLVRLFLSLIILGILGFGLLLAYKSFSGYDPLSTSPSALINSFSSKDAMIAFLVNLLEVDPSQTFDQAKGTISNETGIKTGNTTPSAPIKYRFAVMADSHKDMDSLVAALNLAKERDVKFVVGMGDFSDVGTIEELRNTKIQFDAAGIPYYVGAGDHDLWDSRDKGKPAETNFKEVFGTPFQTFSYADTRVMIIYNSDNYLGLDEFQLKWIEDELARISADGPKQFFVFAPTPLFHPSSDHVMGKVTPKLKDQAVHLMSIFKKAGVDHVFSADTHFFSAFTEPKNELKMNTVGAVTSERNPQPPRFAIVDVFEDGSYNVEEVEVK